jgi:thiamine kinase-like enzyme
VWDSGPHAETARELLRVNFETVAERFERYDEGVVSARAVRDQWVVTHGEPHGSNVLTTVNGTRLIDWDTALIAPRERDVWHLDSNAGSAVATYSAAGGPPADADLLDMYRIQWDLMEIASYIALFCDAHEDTEDARESLRNLRHYIAPRL